MPLQINNNKGEIVIDPYKCKERFEKWNRKIRGVNSFNQNLIVNYVEDMSKGINIAPGSKKGSRSYEHLLTLKERMGVITRFLEERLDNKNLSDLKEEEIHELFNEMRSGKIKKKTGKPYKSTGDYVKVFRAFWHWYMRVKKKKGGKIPDICVDLDGNYGKKPPFVFFTFDDVKKMANMVKLKYKALILFLFDTGIRAPTEMMNVKVKDLVWLEKQRIFQLNIREETSKTFGRKIKLMLCSSILKDFIEYKKLQYEDFIFQVSPRVVNQYFKKLGKQVIGEKTTSAGKSGLELTMYDFRHCSACYWLPRYKSEAALKYRFGWKKSDMIHYYTDFLGMKDTIDEDDMYVDVSKTELEKELDTEKKQREILSERLEHMEKQLAQINNKFLLENIKPRVEKANDEELIELVRKIKENGLAKELKGML